MFHRWPRAMGSVPTIDNTRFSGLLDGSDGGGTGRLSSTEISYGGVTGGWNRNLAERFFRRLERGRPVGRSLTLAKRSLIDCSGGVG